jgi:hypothetical protein
MSQLEVDKIIPQSGTTLTIGDSGDTISFADGATLAIDTNTLAIDSTNNRVGIGTSSPDRILHLEGALPIIKGTDTDGGYGELSFNAGRINIKADDGNNVATSYITFEVDGSEHARIDSSGNVGIGTSSPSSYNSLADNLVVGTTSGDNGITIATGTANGGRIIFSDNTASPFRGAFEYDHSTDSMITYTSGTERMRIDSSGRVGIDETDNSTYVLGKKLVIGDLDNNDGLTLKAIDSTDTNYLAFADTDNGAGSYAGFAGYSHNDNSFRIGTSSLERMRIDSSGNVGIGTTSTQAKLHIMKTDVGALNNSNADMIMIENSTAGITIGSATTGEGHIHFSDSGDADVGGISYFHNDNSLKIRVNAADRMLILNNGDIFFSNTTETAIGNGSTDGKMIDNADGARLRSSRASTSTREHLVFYNPNSGVGSITTSGSSTSYNTSSDYRLKENVVEISGATERLKQLQPKRFNFIADADTTVDGFLAHEVSSIVPEAITGTHNEVQVWEEGEELPEGVSVGDNKLDSEGNTIPVYQGIDQSKLVPLLVATIKELEARITALET